MKKITALTIFVYFLSFTSNSQITKNNWMLGGNASISFVNQTINSASAKGLNIGLSPNVGYFFIDKMAGGIRGKYGFNKVTSGSVFARTSSFNIGPFARYYFLEKENRVNYFADATFQFGKSDGNNTPSESFSNFIVSTGPVIYFNSSVGVEVALNYDMFRTKARDAKANTFFITVGFQIHLEKDRNTN